MNRKHSQPVSTTSKSQGFSKDSTSAPETSKEMRQLHSTTVDDDGTVTISPSADIILSCRAHQQSEACHFKVERRGLVAKSKYFDRLLSDQRFAEGATLIGREAQRQALDQGSCADWLPVIQVIDIGRISPVKSIRPLLTDFFLSIQQGQISNRKMPLINLANLAITADRFDASSALAEYVQKTNMILRPKALKYPLSEETIRQRLLVGLLLNDNELVRTHSKDLISHGSRFWVATPPDTPNDALWYDLPRNIEEELFFRRNAILETIWSLIDSCLREYTSKNRQCRLGYDTSPQCDSFQLGEFVRFLVRTGFLEFTSNIDNKGHHGYCDKSLIDILTALKSCPSYQLDKHHSHCGLRKRFVAALEFIESCLGENEIGVCLECWNDGRMATRSWGEVNRILAFDVDRASKERQAYRGLHGAHSTHVSNQSAHASREFFTAREQLWNLENTAGNAVPVRMGGLQSLHVLNTAK